MPALESDLRRQLENVIIEAREVAEAALAHTVGSEVERAYRRGDALNERRKMMVAWANYLSKIL